MPLRPVGASVRNTIMLCLLADITAIVDSQSQTDPQFRTARLYTCLSAAKSAANSSPKKAYTDEALPTAATITSKLNALGYYPKKVAKSQPQKSRKPTRFEQVTQIDHAADAADDVLPISMDAKATVKVGPFARGGKSPPSRGYRPRLCPGGDSDLSGIFLLKLDELFVRRTAKVTSDCLVDRLRPVVGVRPRAVRLSQRW